MRVTCNFKLFFNPSQTISAEQVQCSSIFHLPRRHQVEDERNSSTLQLIIMTQQNIWKKDAKATSKNSLRIHNLQLVGTWLSDHGLPVCSYFAQDISTVVSKSTCNTSDNHKRNSPKMMDLRSTQTNKQIDQDFNKSIIYDPIKES